jgi:hypothetical protein
VGIAAGQAGAWLLIAGLFTAVVALGAAIISAPTRGDLASYFPPETFTTAVNCAAAGQTAPPPMDDFRAEWYGKIWRAADEPSLYVQAHDTSRPARRTFRFTLIPTFKAPIVVRLDERPDGRMAMTAKRLSGQGGYDPGQLAGKIERVLTHAETSAVLRVLEDSRIMTVSSGDCAWGLDGTQWIFEGVETGRVHFVDRWSPEHGPVHDVGATFLALTGWGA